MLFTPHTLCEINNKEVRPNSALCLQVVVWASATLHHATVLQTSSTAGQLSEDSQCTWVFVWVTGQPVHDRFNILTLRFSVCECMWASRRQWWAVSCCSERAPLGPPSFLAPVTDRVHSARAVTHRTYPTGGGWFCGTCWTCVSGLAVAQISQPGREGLLMNVQEGQAHSVCWEKNIYISVALWQN